MRLCWWAKVKELCGSSWSQDTTSFLRLTTRKARGAHIKEIAGIYRVAFSILDCVKDDCVKDLVGGAASNGGLAPEGSSSACSMSVCGKTSPSARGLTVSKLQRIEETVSVKVSRGRARSDVVSLPLGRWREAWGLPGFRIEGHCYVKVEMCCVPS